MKRISNRNPDTNQHQAPQVHYVERVIEAPAPAPEIRYVEVPVEVERIVEVEKLVHVSSESVVDLSDINSQLEKHEAQHKHSIQISQQIMGELEMQRRALVGLKQQRDIDRDRRLRLIKRLRREQMAHNKSNLKLKLAIGASLILSIAAILLH